MTTLRTHFTFRVDTRTPDGESIVEHIAGVEDYEVALATYHAACERWPGTCYRAGNGSCDVRQHPSGLRQQHPRRCPGARGPPQQRRDDARRYVYAALHWCTNHYSEICDSVRELMGAGVFQTPADVSVLSNVSTRDAFALGSSNPTPPHLISPSLGNPFSNWRRVLSLIPVAAAVSLTVISS